MSTPIEAPITYLNKVRMAPFRALLVAMILVAWSTCLFAENWPAWRGPDGNGVVDNTDLPLRWSRTEGVHWRTPLPEPGNSTPVVWGDRVFVTQSIGTRRSLLCFHRADGRELWSAGIEVLHPERRWADAPYCAPSPSTDGDRVICWFGSGGLICYDLDGRELWRLDLGRHDHVFGYGSSPVLHGDTCYLNFGPGEREFLIAVDKHTGKERWRRAPPVAGGDNIHGTWSTPLLVRTQAGTELISCLRGELAGLDPDSGQVRWFTGLYGIQSKTSPVAGEGVVVLSGDKGSSEIAARLGGSGDITESHVLWRRHPPHPRVGTGVIHQGHYYGVRAAGLADCLDLRTGEVIWAARLRGDGGNALIWSSPLLAGDRLYVSNQSGDTFIIRAAPRFELIAVNSLGEEINASAVPSGRQILLRTHEALWCLGDP